MKTEIMISEPSSSCLLSRSAKSIVSIKNPALCHGELKLAVNAKSPHVKALKKSLQGPHSRHAFLPGKVFSPESHDLVNGASLTLTIMGQSISGTVVSSTLCCDA